MNVFDISLYLEDVNYVADLNLPWEKLNNKFPKWKKNEILNKNTNMKNLYIKSVNKITYKMYCMVL